LQEYILDVNINKEWRKQSYRVGVGGE